jgi:hypothetical protein
MNQTASMGFPYPASTDAPCDFDEQWCEFTGAIDGVFDKWESGLNRAYPAIPAALLRQTELTTIINFNPIPFSEVVLDTAGMTNLDADPYGIVIPRAGRYSIFAAIEENDTSGGAGAQSSLLVSSTDFNISESNILLVLGAGLYRNNVSAPVLTMTEGMRITLTVFLSGQATRTAPEISLGVYWHSDVVRP